VTGLRAPAKSRTVRFGHEVEPAARLRDVRAAGHGDAAIRTYDYLAGAVRVEMEITAKS
jgi:hypothetical protein